MYLLGETQRSTRGTSHTRYRTCPLHPLHSMDGAKIPGYRMATVLLSTTYYYTLASNSAKCMPIFKTLYHRIQQ